MGDDDSIKMTALKQTMALQDRMPRWKAYLMARIADVDKKLNDMGFSQSAKTLDDDQEFDPMHY